MFNYGLFLSLFLLTPGFACWCSLRLSNSLDDVNLVPERDGSTITIGIILISSLLSHFLMESFFAIGQFWCNLSNFCFKTDGDPDIYHGLITMGKPKGSEYPTSSTLWIWLFQILIASLISFFLTKYLLKIEAIQKFILRHTYSWLYPMIELLRNEKDSVLIARVLTNNDIDGRSIVFDGEVVNFTFGDKKQICNISLSEVMAYTIGKQGKTNNISIRDFIVSHDEQSGPFYPDRAHDRVRVNISEDNISTITFEIFQSSHSINSPES